MSSNTFNVKANAVAGNFPAYSKPRVIGYYSLDSDSNYCGDLSQLKYIHLPANYNVKFDLDHGRKLAQKKYDSYDEKVDNLLRWMLQNSNGGNWYVLKLTVVIVSKGVRELTLQISYGNKHTSKNYNTKFLGFMIDNKLSWGLHSDEIVPKLNKA
jgi:hypothetical protein